ncbi:MAG: leucine-rich repeat domain-containing protein [Treponema sp.]|jgi:tetratricopeptide (TPR) repeat protein|nr:leucine-rich repeat domain-containing protein [Treponema sp.]
MKMAEGLRKLYYDLEVAESAGLDYKTFMERQWVQDLSGTITKSAAGVAARLGGELEKRTGEIRDAMYRNSGRIVSAIDDQTSALAASNEALGRINEAGFTRVNNTLEAGFAGVSNQLGGISEQLGELGAAFALGTARIVDAVDKMSAGLAGRLDAIGETLKSRILTDARELYGFAVKSYRAGLYEAARDDLLRALELNRTDYRAWYLLGMVYLGIEGPSTVISLEDALNALYTAAMYCPHSGAEGGNLAAEIRFYLGLAKLFKSHELRAAKKTAEAREWLTGGREEFKISYSYSPLMLESLYNAARCETLLGDAGEALEDLRALIEKDWAYYIKAVNESDFAPIHATLPLLAEWMRDEVYEKAAPVFEKLRAVYARAEGEGLLPYFSGDALFVDQLRRALNKDLPYVDMRDRYEELKRAAEELAEEIPKAKQKQKQKLLEEQQKRFEALFEYRVHEDMWEDYAVITGYKGPLPLREMELPERTSDGLTVTVKDGVFAQFSELTAITVDDEHTRYRSRDGVIFRKSREFLIRCPAGKTGAYAIPPGITEIHESAFDGCTALTSVTIPPSVTTIEKAAFRGCTALTSITIPPGVKVIEQNAFVSCTRLASVTISPGVKVIEENAFRGCTGLTNVTIPPSVTAIWDNAFEDCTALRKLIIPPGVTSMSSYERHQWIANALRGKF